LTFEIAGGTLSLITVNGLEDTEVFKAASVALVVNTLLHSIRFTHVIENAHDQFAVVLATKVFHLNSWIAAFASVLPAIVTVDEFTTEEFWLENTGADGAVVSTTTDTV
jgi:hypothetical protein